MVWATMPTRIGILSSIPVWEGVAGVRTWHASAVKLLLDVNRYVERLFILVLTFYVCILWPENYRVGRSRDNLPARGTRCRCTRAWGRAYVPTIFSVAYSRLFSVGCIADIFSGIHHSLLCVIWCARERPVGVAYLFIGVTGG